MESGYVERPDYRVELLARTNHVTASLAGVVLAETDRPLVVDEQDHALAFYFPPDDVRFDSLERTDHHTVCPFKGEASYWRTVGDNGTGIAWSYESPSLQVAQMAGFVSFYADEVQIVVGPGGYTGPRL